MCCYRDIKNFERFNLVVQSLICLTVVEIKKAETLVEEHLNRISAATATVSNNNNNGSLASSTNESGVSALEISTEKKDESSSGSKECETENDVSRCPSKTEESFTLPELEKLLILVAKVFLLNFPLYIAYKHAVHSRLDDISAQDAQVCIDN